MRPIVRHASKSPVSDEVNTRYSSCSPSPEQGDVHAACLRLDFAFDHLARGVHHWVPSKRRWFDGFGRRGCLGGRFFIFATAGTRHLASPSSSARSPDPAPNPAMAEEVPAIEALLLADPAYAAMWMPKQADGLVAVLTGLSEALASTVNSTGDATIDENVAQAIEKRKLASVYIRSLAPPTRTGHLMPDFADRLTAYLASIKSQPHLGVWTPSTTTKGVPRNFSALAWWVNPNDAGYAREFLAARRDPAFAWAPVRDPYLPYLARERAALERLARITSLTDDEAGRLAELRASKLGDDPPTPINLTQLLSEYGSNEVRADDAYKGKVVEFSGTAGEIQRSAIGGISLAIGTGKRFETPKVKCFFDDAQTTKVKALSKGDSVRVRGRVQGAHDGCPRATL